MRQTILYLFFNFLSQIEISPYLLQEQKCAPWVQLFCNILEAELPAELTNQTESEEAIEALNKQPNWVLKGTVAQITLKLFQK